MSTRLKNLFHNFIENYNTELLDARATLNFKKPLGNVVRHDIPELLSTGLDKSIYTIKGSVGAGRWTDVPWISIFDKRITKSAQKGIYIVYLLNKDTKELFLTLNQGATSVAQSGDSSESSKSSFTAIAKTNSAKTTISLQNEAIRIRELIHCNLTHGSISTGSPAYDAGCIFYKKYDLESIPDDEVLYDDLNAFITAYSKYYNDVFLVDKWWPSLEEYTPNINKNDWLKILNNQNIIDSGYGEFLAMFYTEPEGAACSAIAEKFSMKSPTSIISKCTHLAKRIHQSTNCPLVENVENAKYWPVLFLGKDNKTDGTYIWKLRPELYDALTEFGIEKYLPHQTGIFDSWEIIDENTAVKTCDKSFFEHNGSGVPKGICWYFNADDCNPGDRIDIEMEYAGNKYNARVSNESSDRRRVRIFWNSELGEKFKEKQNIEGIKLKFTKQGTDKYSVDFINEKETSQMSTKDIISVIIDYITNQGFSYPGKLVENFYLSLKSKPFVILAGTSGTGKTRLVRLFAEAINAEYKLVPVRPDWSDSSDLFGHVNLNDKFVSGAIIDFIKAANDNPSKPYILCLDEMNLARVEYYLSDFLSIIETRDMRDGIIVTDPLISIDKYGIDTDAIDKYGELSFPENLYVVGTVNMDETTFPFSKKVLDRANTIEFNYVDLMPSFSNNEEGEKISVDNSFLRSQYLKLAECTGEDEFIKTACTELQNINLILQTANLHIGYRVRDEIVFYLLNNKNSENLITYNDAFDNQLLQKILPRVQGSSESIRKMLCELFKHVAGDFELANGNSDSERMQKVIDDNKCKYPKSAAKIQMMISRFEDDGFTSYWL